MSDKETTTEDVTHQGPELIEGALPVGLGGVAVSGEVEKTSVGLGMSLDKDILLKAPLPPHITDQSKINELGAMVENFAKLPERLEFKPGITLIVGDNGRGKSTLGRALHLVSGYEWYYQENVKEGRDPDEARKAAGTELDVTYDREDTQSIELRAAGIPREIARAFAKDVTVNSAILPEYIDVSSIAGMATQRAREMAETKYRQGTETVQGEDGVTTVVSRMVADKGQHDQSRGSTRQTVDAQISRIIERTQKWAEGQVVYFVDEPETGLSPRRHNDIQQEIEDIFVNADSAHGANTVIVPTNSVILFNSDLPRIDLDYPERGIHRPSDYTEHSS